MRKKIFNWLGREFVALSAEARSGASAKDELQELLARFSEELSSLGLSLTTPSEPGCGAETGRAATRGAKNGYVFYRGKRDPPARATSLRSTSIPTPA